LWFIEQLEPGNTVYNIPGALRLEGRLDLNALERAINEIVRRHEVLRTRIEVEEGEPVQMIDEWEPRRLEITDLKGLTREERERETKRIAREEAGRGFDLRRGVLLRVKALELEEEKRLVLFTMHHIVSDGWSMGILSRELGALYKAFSAGEASPLDELPIQYADFAVWQREWLRGEALEEKMNYWRKQLELAPELELPTINRPQKSEAPKAASYTQVMPADIANAVKRFSEQKDFTLFMMLLTAFAMALHRSTGQRDLVIGTDIANRNRTETEPLIGFFVNEILLRINIEGDPTFDDLLTQVRETALNAYLYQDVPFNTLVETLKPERRNMRTPLIRAKLVVQNAPSEPLSLPSLTIGVEEMSEMEVRGGVKCDFLLTYYEREKDIVAKVAYDESIILKSTTIALLCDIERLLVIAVGDPTLKLSALTSKLSDLKKHQRMQKITNSFKLSRV
jgi:NRPS condensation-like uncharacterized protein